MRLFTCLLPALLLGCAQIRDQPEDASSWYDGGELLDVVEPLEFTDQPYAAPSGMGIGDYQQMLFPAADGDPVFGPGDGYATSGCPNGEDNALPFEIEGTVTLHPRFYFKTIGCDGDEKYYGSFFVEDATWGFFVLGDSKVAHFDMGDTVRMRVRAVRTTFDVDMVYAHDIVSVERTAGPIYYESLTSEPNIIDNRFDAGRVKRIEGTVITDKDTFGEFQVEGDDGSVYNVSLDAEINRRGVGFDIGTRIRVTGPMLYSFSTFNIIVMRVGQLELID